MSAFGGKADTYGNLSVWSKRVTQMCKRLLRFEGTQIAPGDAAAPEGAQALLLNAMNVAPEAEDDFNACPGRARLATKPSWTGSSVTLKTIGIVDVAALAASVAGTLAGVAISAT